MRDASAINNVLLKRVLLAPARAGYVRLRAHAHTGGHRLSLGCAALDAVLTATIGVLALSRGAVTAAPVDLYWTVALAVAAATGAAGIRAVSRATAPAQETPLAWAVRAALSTLAAVVISVLVGALISVGPAAPFASFALWAMGAAGASAGLRLAAVRLSQRHGFAATRVAVVGSPQRTATLAGALAGGAQPGWRLARHVPDDDLERIEELRALTLSGDIDVVILALDPAGEAHFETASAALADTPARLCVAQLGAEPLTPAQARLVIHDVARAPYVGVDGLVKRAMDILLAGAALIVLTPVLLLAAAAIRLDSPGAVLFRQWRFGGGSQPFQVLKLRTMRCEAGDPTGERRTLARDPRVTRVGRLLRRTSLDELPQLINVLRGEMSLVGPRPHALHMKVEGRFYFDAVETYRGRHRVRPGITGWAQVNGSRGEIDTIEKARRRVELDRWYIENWSLSLDIRILVRTVLGGFATRSD
ncbi:MAG TPA: exopolysaccharide biosynthesis polyprenyl glycosylphosphotransferase [Acetobacteraceae bacterium]|nr:exopolysaccharide biosynthesis polyprenyl glycosylphosphotransferase [Acetobacteraceae bacterium]